jgi:chromosome partitioning protein
VRCWRSAVNNPRVVPHILAVANQKGGVGKTTTTINVGASLAGMGRRVLIIDIDPQANATSGLGVDRAALEATSYDVVVNGRALSDARITTMIPGLDIVPADLSLAGAEIEMINLARRERRLAYALEAVDDVDYVLIDCPPSLGLLTVNAATAAQALLVPIQCEFYALEGLGLLTHTLALLRRELNPELSIAGIVMTLYDGRLALARQVVEEVRARFASVLLAPFIPRNVRLSEAPSHGLPVSLYDPTCRGATAYAELAANLDRRLDERAEGSSQAVPAGAAG